MLSMLKKVLFPSEQSSKQGDSSTPGISPHARKVLNVGGNNKKIPIPKRYDGWDHVLLDIDWKGAPDVVCDAREMVLKLPSASYDSVYCSHNLEHYYRHDATKVLAGFLHVLKDDGYAFIRVPDMGEVMRTAVRDHLDIDDVLYQSSVGPITVSDVIYGYGLEIEESGNDFYAHKTGFTEKSLRAILEGAGFPFVFTQVGGLEIKAIAFKNKPTDDALASFDLVSIPRAEPGNDVSPQAELLDKCLAHKTRGNEFLAQGKLEDAANCYRQAISINPDYAVGYLNLGFVSMEQKRYGEAESYLKKAANINPELPDVFYMLGTIAQERGDLNGAIENFNKAVEIKPDFEIVYRDLCHAHFQNGHYDLAKNAIMKGLALNSESADFHYFLGNLYFFENDSERAIISYKKALALYPDYAAVHANMGKVCLEVGKIDEAIEWYGKAAQLEPDSAKSDSCLLFIRHFDSSRTPAQHLADARQYGKKVMALVKPYTHAPVDPATHKQPLRVGMVSGDFFNHPVGYFLESILANLNQDRFEWVAYSTQPKEDSLTTRIKNRFALWNSIAGLSDEVAAKKILEDQIDILIDLSGHTTNNRLSVFAWKPAPLQVSWLGYFGTTGLPGMDYLLTDRVSLPENQQEFFTEKACYLPDTRLCFTPPVTGAQLAITPLPMLRNGFITFGCFQKLGKVTDSVLTLWGRVSHALPQARFRFQNKQMESQTLRERLLQRLIKAGIGPDQILLKGPVSREDYLNEHAEVDIVLDTFPYPGGTTTCEALWMGVPTLTLSGDTLLARQGASLLTCIGLADWIAYDEEEYIALALAHASDAGQLAQLRSELRQKLINSPLCDAPRFARNLEDALDRMWRQE